MRSPFLLVNGHVTGYYDNELETICNTERRMHRKGRNKQ